MNEEKDARLLSRAAAELESARVEFASLDGSASASRAERAAYRLRLKSTRGPSGPLFPRPDAPPLTAPLHSTAASITSFSPTGQPISHRA